MRSVAFSPDGRMLAAGGDDDKVHLWDVTDPAGAKPVGEPLTGHSGLIHSVAFSPDGRTLASGSADDTVRLWDVSDPARARPAGHRSPVTPAPSGRWPSVPTAPCSP
ncbi:WD40 repeat domain-containing protein [Streptomyces sp. PU10]|uniref:WD40 repeat domain-containing protein n=1 Tax=Streptomyces sp. PU10 TaxID=3062780 RepID=UPI003965AC03